MRLLLIGLLVFLSVAGYFLYQAIPIATAFSAKILCSAVFVSKRPEASVIEEDLEWFPFLDLAVDREQETAGASFWGFFRRAAFFREGLGCTLMIDTTRDVLLEQTRGFTPSRAVPPPFELWPRGERVAPDDIVPRVQELVDAEVRERDPETPLRTRALVVVHRGRLVAESYAPGFDSSTRLAGWSMAKSVTAALVGILVREKLLAVDSPPPVPEWPPGDPRSTILLDQLLRMTSGLYFEEFYFGPSTATRMLFSSYSTAALAATQPFENEPGSRWHYSSGTSNIISRVIRHRLGGKPADYLGFPRRALFEPLAMQSAVFEPDPSGTFVGSSFLYATARDWARFGQFFLQDGVWEGQRLLPEGWVAYCTKVTPQSPKGRYGAHWWLNRGQPPDSPNRIWPQLPSDIYFASGFEGQYVLVIPSRDVVIVRLGLSHPPGFFNLGEFTHSVLERLDEWQRARSTIPSPLQLSTLVLPFATPS